MGDAVPDFAGTRPARILRSVAVAVSTFTLAVGGHVAGGGAAPPMSVIAVLLGLIVLIAWLLSPRQFSPSQLAGLLLLGQAFVHLTCVLTVAGGMTTDAPMMVLGHGLATAATATLLHHGEGVLWSLAEKIGLRAIGFANTAASPLRQRESAHVAVTRNVAMVPLCYGNVRADRGPPECANVA